MTPRSMVVAGVMSGTSADGADVALVRVTPRSNAVPRMRLLHHAAFPYPARLRKAVLAAMAAPAVSVAELAQLHWRLGEFYGDAVAKTLSETGVRASLVGVHGQTIYHQAIATKFLGAPLRCTWQIGEASEVAHRTGLPVVSDFRPADMVVGGQAAPLVPKFDQVFYSHSKRNRVLQNLGGIANLTAIAAGSERVLAFDSGPASVVIDGCMQQLYGRLLDRNGATARRGRVLQNIVDETMRMPYFSAAPPKSCGREEFGGSFITRFVTLCKKQKCRDEDVIATATALTAQSILQAYRTFVWPFLGQRAPLASGTDYIVAGGGANNLTLMRQLREGLEPLGVRVSTSAETGVPPEAKEAMAFALLAWLRWHGLPGNVPAATGAVREAILGRITLP